MCGSKQASQHINPRPLESSGCICGAHSSLVQITQTIKTDWSPQTQNSALWLRLTDPSRWKPPVPLLPRHKHTSHTTIITNTEWKPDCTPARLTPEPEHWCCLFVTGQPCLSNVCGSKTHQCTSTGVWALRSRLLSRSQTVKVKILWLSVKRLSWGNLFPDWKKKRHAKSFLMPKKMSVPINKGPWNMNKPRSGPALNPSALWLCNY